MRAEETKCFFRFFCVHRLFVAGGRDEKLDKCVKKWDEKIEILIFCITLTTTFNAMKNYARIIWNFYRDGFRSMTLGRTLWLIILLKLFIMFVVLRLIFFPNQMAGLNAEERADKVMNQLVQE